MLTVAKQTIKITADYVIDEYQKTKKLTGSNKQSALQHVVFLSKNLNKLLAVGRDVTKKRTHI